MRVSNDLLDSIDLGYATGLPVIESVYASLGVITKITGDGFGDRLIVRSKYLDVLVPLMLADLRQGLMRHLGQVVRAAELRLGLGASS